MKELGHDAETGAPKVKFHDDRMSILELSWTALDTLAKIRGLMRDAPTPPPKPDLLEEEALRTKPIEALEAFYTAYQEAAERAKAINVQAKRIGE